MGFYHTESGVDEYVEMAKGFDGASLIERLRRHLPDGASVLEVGMGPGVDLDILARSFVVTGSDYSRVFLDRYLRDHPDADLLLLDARTLETERRFDCIYSNKVLHHLSTEELHASLLAQTGLLNAGGLALHSFWWGDREEEWMEGLRFAYYTEETLAEAVTGTGFEIVEMERYSELEADDSIVLVLRAAR